MARVEVESLSKISGHFLYARLVLSTMAPRS